jgi:hypothetical protein
VRLELTHSFAIPRRCGHPSADAGAPVAKFPTVFAGWVTVRAAGEAMDRRRVLIVGGGIAGLALAPQV